MRALALLVALFVASSALAAVEPSSTSPATSPCPECPAPPRLNCDQLRSRLVSRKCGKVDCEPVPCKPTAIFVDPPAAGHWLIGLGPVVQHNWGATAVVGYQFASGWQLQAGPVWLPRKDVIGTVTDGCVTLPYSVDGGGPWGAQAILSYRFHNHYR